MIIIDIAILREYSNYYFERKQEWKVRVKRRNSHFAALYMVVKNLRKIKSYSEIPRCQVIVRENLLK